MFLSFLRPFLRGVLSLFNAFLKGSYPFSTGFLGGPIRLYGKMFGLSVPSREHRRPDAKGKTSESIWNL